MTETDPARTEVADAAELMAGVEREVREKRRSGELPAELERELDALFESLAPPGAAGQSYDAALARAERAAVIDPVGPVASRLPGVAFARRLIRRVIAFYVEHVARQVSAFAGTIVRAVALLGTRVDDLEARSSVTDPMVRSFTVPVSADLDVVRWLDVVREHVVTASGRVLHAECGDGRLLVALREAGVDAYGVDPRPDAARAADERDVEARTVSAAEHLRSLPDRSLGGLVLSHCVDRLPLGDLLEVVRRSASVLAPGAPLVVVSAHPNASARVSNPIVSDLAPGRPLHPETWTLLLGREFRDVTCHSGAAPQMSATGQAAADANFALLAARLLGPDSFAVTARRAGT